MIYKHDDGTCTISADRVWRPGVFESEKAARMGQRLLDEEIQELQDEVNARESDPEKRFITEAMIRAKPRRPKAPVEDCWQCKKKLWGGGRYFHKLRIDGEVRYLHLPCAERRIEEGLVLMPKMTVEICDEIYNILVKECGASESNRTEFQQYLTDGKDWHEFRFGGRLGTGGKFYDNGRWTVGCYKEDDTPDRRGIINKTNLILTDLLLSKVL